MVTLTNGVIQWEYCYYCYCYYIIYMAYNRPLSAEQPLPIRYHRILGILHSWNHCQQCYCYLDISIIAYLLSLTVDSHQYRVCHYLNNSKQSVFDGISFIYSIYYRQFICCYHSFILFSTFYSLPTSITILHKHQIQPFQPIYHIISVNKIILHKYICVHTFCVVISSNNSAFQPSSSAVHPF